MYDVTLSLFILQTRQTRTQMSFSYSHTHVHTRTHARTHAHTHTHTKGVCRNIICSGMGGAHIQISIHVSKCIQALAYSLTYSPRTLRNTQEQKTTVYIALILFCGSKVSKIIILRFCTIACFYSVFFQ